MGTQANVKLPSLARMRCRLDWAHESVLGLFVKEQKVSACFLNGYPVSRQTLIRWKCIEIQESAISRDTSRFTD